MFADISADLLRAVVVHQIIRHDVDAAVVSEFREQANDAKEPDIAAGAGKWFGHEPVEFHASKRGSISARSAVRASGV